MSAGGVERPHALAKVPAFSACSSLCRGKIGTLSSRRTPGANGSGNVTTTVCGSGAEISRRLPLIWSESASTVAARSSYAAWNVNRTSSAVNGWPSENVTFCRSASATRRPSSDAFQLSASQGSTSWVFLLIRTSRACVNVATRSVLESRAASRLNVRGSVRTDATSSPPRFAVDPPAGAAARWHAQPPAIAAMRKTPACRRCPVKSWPIG
jgi:hypothetical protein